MRYKRYIKYKRQTDKSNYFYSDLSIIANSRSKAPRIAHDACCFLKINHCWIQLYKISGNKIRFIKKIAYEQKLCILILWKYHKQSKLRNVSQQCIHIKNINKKQLLLK